VFAEGVEPPLAAANTSASVVELERRLGKDSSTSSSRRRRTTRIRRSPGTGRCGSGAGGAGKQPGGQSSTLRQVASPDDTVVCAPAACGQCGAGLADAPVTGVQKLQEFDITPPPPPQGDRVPGAGLGLRALRHGHRRAAAARVTRRAQYGPEVTISRAED
jgi:hypothetical protein